MQRTWKDTAADELVEPCVLHFSRSKLLTCMMPIAHALVYHLTCFKQVAPTYVLGYLSTGEPRWHAAASIVCQVSRVVDEACIGWVKQHKHHSSTHLSWLVIESIFTKHCEHHNCASCLNRPSALHGRCLLSTLSREANPLSSAAVHCITVH